MYNSQEIALRIKSQAKLSDIKLKTMLADLGLGINIVSHLAKGQDLSYCNLAKIADYLGCSVDYLLGRTDNPQAHMNSSSVSVGNVSGNSGAIGVGNVVNSTEKNTAINQQTAALLETFNKLTPVEQAKVLVYADELTNK